MRITYRNLFDGAALASMGDATGYPKENMQFPLRSITYRTPNVISQHVVATIAGQNGDSLGSGVQLMGTNTGHILKSTDDGLTWTDKGQLGTATTIARIVNIGSGRVIAATQQTIIYLSTDSGETFTNVKTVTGNFSVAVVVTGSGATAKVLAFTQSGYVYTSTDGGSTWDAGYLQAGSPNWAAAISFGGTAGSEYVFAGSNAGAGYQSTNGGTSFTALGTIGTATAINRGVYLSGSGSTGVGVIAVSSATSTNRIYKTTNGGSTWTAKGNVITPSRLKALNSVELAVIGGNTIYKSSDAGETWTAVYTSVDNPVNVTALQDIIFGSQGNVIVGTQVSSGNAYIINMFSLSIDLGSAQSCNALAVLNHNFISDDYTVLQGADDSAFTTNLTEFVITPTASNYVYYFTSTSRRYWRLKVFTGVHTYYEIGRIILGSYYEPSKTFDVRWSDTVNDLSRTAYSTTGQAHTDKLSQYTTLNLTISNMQRTQKSESKTLFAAVGTNTDVLLSLDPVSDLQTLTYYGRFIRPFGFQHTMNTATTQYFTLPLEFRESL